MHELTRRRRHAGAGLALGLSVLLVGCGDGGNPVGSGQAPSAPRPPVAGVNLDVAGGGLDEAALDALTAAGVAWIALIPFGWQPRFDAPEVRLRTTGVRWSETDAGLEQITARAHERGLRVLLKPHIWLVEPVAGQWRGTIGFDTEAGWSAWESDYRAFLLHYAALAQASGADLLCVGVELQRPAVQRPAFWRALIDSVRQVYDGPLTYGANWEGELAAVSFWDRLDYIGVHAYFPLTSRQDASVADLERGWAPHRRLLEAVSTAWQRPVLFTEVGYRSIAGAGVRPWDYAVAASVDVGEQADAYEALFRTFWDRDWFAGVFVWAWETEIDAAADLTGDDGYTPQGKPAQAVMRRWFEAGS